MTSVSTTTTGGNPIVKRILIANNGQAAMKGVQSMKEWTQRLQTIESRRDQFDFVMMASPEDQNASSSYIMEGRVHVDVPGGSSCNNYANPKLIYEKAVEMRCDFIWPGWGHASENHELPKMIEEHNLKDGVRPIGWIGPTSAAMRALGDKVGSTIIAQTADVPCAPWSGQGVKLNVPSGAKVSVDDLTEEDLRKSSVESPEECVAWIKKLGLPCMIKAADGGGGKGVRKVTEDSVRDIGKGSLEDCVKDLYRAVRNEVKVGRIFVMKMLTGCRHLEVQIVADKHGTCWPVGSRDCSIQRRFQKIIEEGPVVSAPPEVVKEMEAAASRICTLVGYESAGTVEFLYDPTSKEFYFLEVNARLQVEHVVTEMNSDTNLVAIQLMIALGYKLEDIPGYNEAMDLQRRGVLPEHHVIAARITAEDVENGWRGTQGEIGLLKNRNNHKAWGYFSVESGGKIHEFADTQFGHIFALGKNRDEAITNLYHSLSEHLDIRGTIRCNVRAVLSILESEEFRLITPTHTTWLDTFNFTEQYNSDPMAMSKRHSCLLYGIIYKFSRAVESDKERFISVTNNGQLSNDTELEKSYVTIIGKTKYKVSCRYIGPGEVSVTMNGDIINASYNRVEEACKEYPTYRITVFGMGTQHVRFQPNDEAKTLLVRLKGWWEETLIEDFDPMQLSHPTGGKLVRWRVKAGDFLEKGCEYAEIEAMKMTSNIKNEWASGYFEPLVCEGASFGANKVIARLKPADGLAAPELDIYQGKFLIERKADEVLSESSDSTVTGSHYGPAINGKNLDECYKTWLEVWGNIHRLLDGYATPFNVNNPSDTLASMLHDICRVEGLGDFVVYKYIHKCSTLSSDAKEQLYDILASDKSALPSGHNVYAIMNQAYAEMLQDTPLDYDLVKLKELLRRMSATSSSNPLYGACVKAVSSFYLTREQPLDAFYKKNPAQVGKGILTRSLGDWLRRHVGMNAEEVYKASLWSRNFNQIYRLLMNLFLNDPDLQTIGYTDFEKISSLTSSQNDLVKELGLNRCRTLSDVLQNQHRHTLNDKIDHDVIDPLIRKRANAKKRNMTYCYDFISVFEEAVTQEWKDYTHKMDEVNADYIKVKKIPKTCFPFVAEELIMKNDRLIVTDRPIGENDIGMVGWKVTMRTPSHPDGRTIILIANDFLFKNGSFGVRESEFFDLCSEMAMLSGLPRIFLASNSGARMGLDSHIVNIIRPMWNDETDHSKGFEYLYLTEDDYNGYKEYVKAEKINYEGKPIYKLLAVVGKEDSIGVENLAGSGKIAGTTQRCYLNGFTLTYVNGPCVGIGAYLARLGSRIIQKRSDSPLLLTGAVALNSLVGKDVYDSNDNIGGVNVMHHNGVSHVVVDDDLEGMRRIVEWLSFVPGKLNNRGMSQQGLSWGRPLLLTGDPRDRFVDVRPTDDIDYNVRDMLDGWQDNTGAFKGGIFDKGSFVEVQSNWGPGVVVGRARLGGLPVGIIAVETHTTKVTIPADPADPDSREEIQSRAAGVWFPDNSYKTATAIKDFNNEALPLFVLANWRGFSGGTRDMYKEILKFGAMIVEALVDYKNPCFVYIPRDAELRGGAWVVIDQNVNPEVMELYADSHARGGIMEPTGVVSVRYKSDEFWLKFRQRMLEQSAEKIKGTYKESTDSLVYRQVLEKFAELHDQPWRMFKKNVIREIVPMEESRKFFYGRLVRQEIMMMIRHEIKEEIGPDTFTVRELNNHIDVWAAQCGRDFQNYKDMFDWISTQEDQIRAKIACLRDLTFNRRLSHEFLGKELSDLKDIQFDDFF